MKLLQNTSKATDIEEVLKSAGESNNKITNEDKINELFAKEKSIPEIF